jgi:hypothetical protein
MIHDKWKLPQNTPIIHPIFLSNVKLKYYGIVLSQSKLFLVQ